MATIKAYTDISQSKKLAEILSLESADMYFIGEQSIINPKEWEYNDTPKIRGKYIAFDDKRIFYPCWSLAALLCVLKYPSLTQDVENKWSITDWTGAYPKSEHGFDNPVDACMDIIIKLKERNII